MPASDFDIVTGAFGYTGGYITKHLLRMGRKVLTLTRHVDRPNPFGEALTVAPPSFEDPDQLTRRLRGANTLYNTYWIRFPCGQATFERAVENTKILLRAAEAAGVRKIVHVSVTNAAETSPLPYFRGKGLAEAAIMRSRLACAIIRPTLIFGAGDILINNMAWLLRHLPVFALPGSGAYRLQPIAAEEVAEIAVSAAQGTGNRVIDAAGPDTFTFAELVRLIRDATGSRARIVRVHPAVALALSRVVSVLVRDVMLTRDEVRGLMAGLLVSDAPPAGRMRFRDWLTENADTVGIQYASELARHFR